MRPGRSWFPVSRCHWIVRFAGSPWAGRPGPGRPARTTLRRTTMAVLEIKDARKAFGATRALDGLSLSLGEGELLGLLGPNGAGKTTLIRAIAGRVRFDGGTVSLYGHTLEPEKPRPDLGVVPQENALYPLLTAREHLETFGQLNGLDGKRLRERVAWALEWSGLAERAKSP